MPLNDLYGVPLSDFQFLFWISSIFEPKVKKLNIITRRRISGKLDISALTFAFESLFEKHEILKYRISSLFPTQYLEKNNRFHIFEKDLSEYSDADRESELSSSLVELHHRNLWKKHTPWVAAKLYHLKNEVSELQICIPHIAFDDASDEILFSELSDAYLFFTRGVKQHTSLEQAQYKDYVTHERTYLNQHIQKDINFWHEYLHDASLVTLPSTEIIDHMKKNNVSYSTYLELSNDVLKNVEIICSDYRVSITDILCASIALALKETVSSLNANKIFINIVRSTRDNDAFDKMIGCFIRLDPIKVDINTHCNLPQLSKSIQQSRIETEQYQACSSMVKLACLDKSYRNKFFRNYFIKLISTIYSALFKKLRLNPQMLAMYGRINSLRTKQRFFINVNILNNFISPTPDKHLFGFKTIKTKTYQRDLSNIDNVLDICLFKNESIDKAYMVISGNLKESFRNQLGNEIIKMIWTANSKSPDILNIF